MARLGALSLRRKLQLAVVTTTAGALLVAFGVLAAHEIVTARRDMVRSARVLAEIVGVNSAAAVVFDDAEAASQTLAALAAERDVVAAALYDDQGRLFASFAPRAGLAPPALAGSGMGFAQGDLELFQPLRMDGERRGTIYIRADAAPVRARLGFYLAILTAVLTGGLVAASLSAAGLGRHFEGPIGELVSRSRAMARGDLTSLVPETARDEIGLLARTWNAMGQSLRALVSEVRDNVRAVGQVTGRLEGTSERLVEETRRQAASVEQTARAIDRVTGSIEQVNASVAELADTGRSTSGSLATMSGSIARVAGHMDRLARAIQATSSEIAGLGTSVEDIAEGVVALDGATGTTEASLAELTASVHQVRDNARRSLELSESAHQDAERGGRSVEDTIASMKEIQASFQELEALVSRLADRSDSIGQIVKVIEDVADETQLLSLNAAIIASQAGEQGAAFAVVADEVKNLAERTAGSTREIAALVQTIWVETEQAVAAMDEGSRRVARGVERSNEAGDRLRAIMRSSTLAREMTDQIVRATGAQDADLQRVDEAMTQVRRIVARIQHSTRAQTRASAEISAMVEEARVLGDEVKDATVAQSVESRRIDEAVQRLTHMIERIVRSTGEQRRGSEQIGAALGVFREVAEQSARRVEELESVVATLSERSSQLDHEIGRFVL